MRPCAAAQGSGRFFASHALPFGGDADVGGEDGAEEAWSAGDGVDGTQALHQGGGVASGVFGIASKGLGGVFDVAGRVGRFVGPRGFLPVAEEGGFELRGRRGGAVRLAAACKVDEGRAAGGFEDFFRSVGDVFQPGMEGSGEAFLFKAGHDAPLVRDGFDFVFKDDVHDVLIREAVEVAVCFGIADETVGRLRGAHAVEVHEELAGEVVGVVDGEAEVFDDAALAYGVPEAGEVDVLYGSEAVVVEVGLEEFAAVLKEHDVGVHIEGAVDCFRQQVGDEEAVVHGGGEVAAAAAARAELLLKVVVADGEAVAVLPCVDDVFDVVPDASVEDMDVVAATRRSMFEQGMYGEAERYGEVAVG